MNRRFVCDPPAPATHPSRPGFVYCSAESEGRFVVPEFDLDCGGQSGAVRVTRGDWAQQSTEWDTAWGVPYLELNAVWRDHGSKLPLAYAKMVIFDIQLRVPANTAEAMFQINDLWSPLEDLLARRQTDMPNVRGSRVLNVYDIAVTAPLVGRRIGAAFLASVYQSCRELPDDERPHWSLLNSRPHGWRPSIPSDQGPFRSEEEFQAAQCAILTSYKQAFPNGMRIGRSSEYLHSLLLGGDDDPRDTALFHDRLRSMSRRRGRRKRR